jgi:hypothetical protein
MGGSLLGVGEGGRVWVAVDILFVYSSWVRRSQTVWAVGVGFEGGKYLLATGNTGRDI